MSAWYPCHHPGCDYITTNPDRHYCHQHQPKETR